MGERVLPLWLAPTALYDPRPLHAALCSNVAVGCLRDGGGRGGVGPCGCSLRGGWLCFRCLLLRHCSTLPGTKCRITGSEIGTTLPRAVGVLATWASTSSQAFLHWSA